MGLLMRYGGTLTIFLFVLSLIEGCGHARMHELARMPESDWVMYGGNIERRNCSNDAITPPLTLAWNYDADAGFGSNALSLAESTLFVNTLAGEVHTIDVSTGNELRTYDFGSAIIGTPVVDGGHIYVALGHEDEGILSCNLFTGSTEWKLKSGDVETAPLLLDQRLVIGTLQRGVLCADKTTGALLWKFEIPPEDRTPTIHSSPASDGTTIVFGCDNGTLYAIRASDGTLRWKVATGKAIVASPSIDSGRVFVGSTDGWFRVYDLDQGTLVWKQQLGAPIHASQAIDSRRVYVGTSGRTFFALDKATGSIVWSFVSNGAVVSSAVVSRDIVYFGSIDKHLYALRCASGQQLWKFETPGRIKSMPIIGKQRLFVPVEDSFVLAFTPVTAP